MAIHRLSLLFVALMAVSMSSFSQDIQKLDPILDHLVAPDAKLERVATGFDKWTEGPVWTREGRLLFAEILCDSLAETARAAGCTGRVTPHRLRHSFATEMVRLGVSLPALMQMLGHKDIRMTMRYVEVVQLDLQREFHRARQNPVVFHSIPQLPLPSSTTPARVDLATVRQAIAATQHLLHLFQPQLEAKCQPKLRRLAQRLLNIDHELDRLSSKNECTLAG